MKKLFISIESILYLLFISFDLFKIDTTIIKYISIVLCFIYALISHKKYRIFSMFFTLIADLFLLVLNKYYEIGVISFIIVQIIYLLFIKKLNSNNFNIFILFRLLIIIIGIIILYLTNNMNLLNILVLIYFSSLLFNNIQAFISRNYILAIGLLLFVGCDICVGLHNLNVKYQLATMLMWVFYLPSQVLIVLA